MTNTVTKLKMSAEGSAANEIKSVPRKEILLNGDN
jgi:hypothetical protein